MPFWRNDSKIVSIFRQTSLVQRFLISVLIILIPSISVIFFIYFPNENKIKQLNNSYQSLISQKQKLDVLLEKQKAMENENKDLINKINLLCPKSDPSDLLLGLVQKHQLKCSDVKPEKTMQKGLLVKDYFNATIKGSFTDEIDFFKELQKSPQVIKICQLKMYKWKKHKIKFDLVFRDVWSQI